MFGSIKALAIVTLAALLVAPAAGSPTIDGTVNPGEYAYGPVTDAAEPGADFYNTGLDIDEMYVDADAVGGSRYLGLTVVNPPFDTNGSALSFAQMTGVGLYFFADDTVPLPTVIMSLAFNALGFIDDLSFYREFNGVSWVETDFDEITAGVDYDLATGAALELRISKSAFKVFNGELFPPYLRLQLDDTGGQQDDQIEGHVPEPAAVSILALGALALLRRRRR